MSKLSINLPPRVRSGQAIKAESFNAIRDAISRLAVRLPPLKNAIIGGSGSGGGKQDCPFGEIITIPADGSTPEKKAIRGGLLIAGDKNWDVEPNELILTAPGEWLVWIEIGVTANIDSGVNMPGLETSTEPTWKKGSVASGYDGTTQPTVGTGTGGKAIIPLGKLTIADGVASFAKTDCGNITVNYCPENLSYSRT